MNGWVPLAIMCGLCLWTAFNYAVTKNWPMALVFTCYGTANIGFIWGLLR